MVRHTHAIGRLLPVLALPVLVLAGCAPLRNYARGEAITQKCIAADELRRGGGGDPRPGPAAQPTIGTPVPVTPADSVARPTTPAAQVKCNGGLSR